MVVCVSATSVSKILFKILYIWCLCVCVCVCVCARFYVVFCCKHLHIESVLYLSMCPCVCVCLFTNMLAFTSLPQVGDNRMTAVKRAEDSRGWDSVMDNDSQQTCGRAQPQALDCSPGEAGEMPARKTPRSSGGGETGS